jgi:hypothetical protein
MMIAMAKHCLTPFAELAIIGQQRVKNIAVNQRRVRFSLLLFRADGELPSTVCDLKLSRTDPPRLFPLRVRHQREATEAAGGCSSLGSAQRCRAHTELTTSTTSESHPYLGIALYLQRVLSVSGLQSNVSMNFMGFSRCISNWGHLDDRASVAKPPRDFSPLDGAERGSNRKFC